MDSFKSGQYPPMCKLQLTCFNIAAVNFEHRLFYRGAQGMDNYFNMKMSLPVQVSISVAK